MKSQKLTRLGKNPILGACVENIINDIKKRTRIENKIKKGEKELSDVLVLFLENPAGFKKVSNVLYMKVTPVESNKKTEQTLSILNAICIQIAGSVNNYYQNEENHSKAKLNWGARFYDVSREEIVSQAKSTGKELRELIEIANKFLKKFDVRIKIHAGDETGSIRFSIEIFPEF